MDRGRVAEQPPVGLVASVFSSLQVKGLGLISFLVFRRERERQIQGTSSRASAHPGEE